MNEVDELFDQIAALLTKARALCHRNERQFDLSKTLEELYGSVTNKELEEPKALVHKTDSNVIQFEQRRGKYNEDRPRKS